MPELIAPAPGDLAALEAQLRSGATRSLAGQLQRRAEIDADGRTVEGIAVPWGEVANIGGWYTEEIQRGAVVESDDCQVWWRHSDPIGLVVSHEDTDAGWEIVGRISDTATGRDALTLARDGVVASLSIGFESIEYVTREDDDGTVHITHTAIRVREVSLVPLPAYAGAAITNVREHTERKEPTVGDTITPAVELELRAVVEDLGRKVDRLPDLLNVEAPAAPDTRSAGAVLRAMVDGDTATIDAYNALQERRHDETLNVRATNGIVLGDGGATQHPAYVGSLVRLFDSASGVLSAVFGRGTLPATGNSIEFLELASNTLRVEEQAAEGDTLAFGKLSFTNRTAPVKTFGGYTELTRQSIERSTAPLLTTALEGLAIEAGKRKKAVLRAAVVAALAERTAVAGNAGTLALGATLAASTPDNWEDVLVDAAIRFDGEGALPEALLVSANVFKKLRSLTIAGQRVFKVAEGNTSGTLDLLGLTGSLAGLPVHLDPGAPAGTAYFANGRAIKQYDTSLASLSDENITNLTKQFSVYFYGAVAFEVPAFIVPVRFNA